jgi:hypothetical protein
VHSTTVRTLERKGLVRRADAAIRALMLGRKPSGKPLRALQWHPKLKHVTEQTFGVLINGLVMSGSKWKSLPPDTAQMLVREAQQLIASERSETRAADDRSYQLLLKRGYVADQWAKGGYEEYLDVEKQVRERLVDRLYSPELLARAMKVAANARGAGPHGS